MKKIEKKKNSIKKYTIIVIAIIFIIFIYALCKNGAIEIVKNRMSEYKEAQAEIDLQAIIDETIEEVQINEQREATLSDLKIKLQEEGYTLDGTTGELKYNDYYVKIGEDLAIISIEQIVTKAQYEIMSIQDEKLNILLTIENKKGIERITGSDITIECKGREKIAIDRTLADGEEYQIKVKVVGEEKEELHTLVASKKPQIVITNVDTLGDGTTKTVEIEYPNNKNLINYYSLDDGETWQEYTGTLNILEKDNKTIAAKSLYKEGKTIDNTEEKVSLVISDSLLSATEKAIMKNDTHYRIAVKDEEYTVHTYIENGNLVLVDNTTYGDKNDIATDKTYANNMVILKINGDLTINENVTLTAYGTEYGGPKGMLVYATGTLTNNGTISMTARGAKAEGQNVYLWKNEDTSTSEYEIISATGGAGGEATTGTGKSGTAGSIVSGVRKSGGGGSGGGYSKISGAGSSGTSYSGGTGGSGSALYTTHVYGALYHTHNEIGYEGSSNGGAGGAASIVDGTSITPGTGNPGGNYGKTNQGYNGTGGTLILYAENLINNSAISANGIAGRNATRGAGGGSGGGIISIFYNKQLTKGTITVTGGKGGNASYAGGSGGDGCIAVGSISTGTYVPYKITQDIALTASNATITGENKINTYSTYTATVKPDVGYNLTRITVKKRRK